MGIAISGFLQDGSHEGHFAYGKYVGGIASWKGSNENKSKLLLDMNKLKNFLQKKVYVHKFYNENYPLSYKKHMHYFFLI